MTSKDIIKLTALDQYSKVMSNPYVHNNLMFLTLGGSHSYGTNTPTSDIDLRGCAFMPKEVLLGTKNFEQVVDNLTDTTIYSFNKLVSLCAACNPNTIEMLGCRPDQYLFFNDMGREFVNCRKMFLSKKAVYSFGGYANQQLRRLENALCRDVPHSQKELHLLNTIQSAMQSFLSKYESFDDGSMNLYIDQAVDPELETEIFIDVDLHHYPLRDYKSIWSEMNNIVKDYGKLGKRNKKKDDEHLNKHAMHLVRLYLTCFDLLEKGDIITYRENDIPMLMQIRNGKYQKEDGSYDPVFFEMIDEMERRLQYAAQNTVLPDKPDYKQIEEFVMSVNERRLRDGTV